MRKRGPRTILNLDDRTGRLEVTLFDEQLQKYRDLIVKDALVMVEGKVRFDEFSSSWRLTAQRITSWTSCASSRRAGWCCAGRPSRGPKRSSIA